jgi:hypothetical protein
MCTGNGANPGGVVATHLLAKVEGSWVEPQNVCVSATLQESGIVGGYKTRSLGVAIQNTVDPGFPDTHLPAGTPISLGLQLPPGMTALHTFGRWRNATVLSDGSYTVMQASTVPWDYHQEAYFGGPGLDCARPPALFSSTFTSYIALNALNPDGTPNEDEAPYGGGFYESNTVGTTFPRLRLDEVGNPTGLQVLVSGCGDSDPSTLEGYFDGYTPASIFHAFGVGDALLRDAAALQSLIEVRDARTGAPVQATFALVRGSDLALEPVPGITLPSPPPGSRIIGVRTTSSFSYSEHLLVQRGRPAAMRALRRCRAEGGRPAVSGGRVTCIPDTKPPRARILSRGAVTPGKPVIVSCNEPCRVQASVTGHGNRLAAGRRTSTKAGKLRVRITLTPAGRRELASYASMRATLRLAVADRAGNKASVHRGVRLTAR